MMTDNENLNFELAAKLHTRFSLRNNYLTAVRGQWFGLLYLEVFVRGHSIL